MADGRIAFHPGGAATGIQWRGDVPSSNYELAVDALWEGGADFLYVVFPIGQSHCVLMAGVSGKVVALADLDGRQVGANLAQEPLTFRRQHWYRLRLRVTDARVEAWLGHRKMIDVKRADHRFTIPAAVAPLRPLGVYCVKRTRMLVSNIQLRTPGRHRRGEAPAKAKPLGFYVSSCTASLRNIRDGRLE